MSSLQLSVVAERFGGWGHALSIPRVSCYVRLNALQTPRFR